MEFLGEVNFSGALEGEFQFLGPATQLPPGNTDSSETNSEAEFELLGPIGTTRKTVQEGRTSTSHGRQQASDVALFRFPKPDVGHICQRCQGIPLETFLVGSSFFSKRCVGHHPQEEYEKYCKGVHEIHCGHCGENIADVHYHCAVCGPSGFDVCADCEANGRHCHNEEHKLRQRIFDNKIVREVADDGEPLVYHPGVTQAVIERGVEPYLLHENMDALKASAEAGCHSCSVLITRLQGVPLELIPSDAQVFIEARPYPVPENIRFIANMTRMMLQEPNLDETADWDLPATMVAIRQPGDWTPEDITRWLAFKVELPTGASKSRYADWVGDVEHHQISPVVHAGNNLKIINTWLQSCLNNDSECTKWSNDLFIPTRLIHISQTASGNDIIRLVDGSSILDAASSYATLSYCWGTSQKRPWLTTMETLPTFQQEIPFAVLPKTIADAVRLLREIDIHYLWVDSICIVQDDPRDWKHEAYLMAQIYQGSLFTIISGSDSSEAGLFLPRDQLKVSAAELTAKSVLDPERHAVVTLYPVLSDIGTIHHDGPSTKRAWCYQEELLSPRRLYFTKGQFVWECVCSSHDEIGTRMPGDINHTSYSLPPYDANVLLANSRTVQERHAIVEEYTSRQLTYHSDIFAALAGVAARLKLRYNTRYFAGLWEDDMLNGLLWQRVGKSLARPTDFKAPTWSWLSVQGQVIYTRGSRQSSIPDAEYVICHVETKDGEEFGVVTSGVLRLRARLLTCNIVEESEGEGFERLANIDQRMPEEITPVNARGRDSTAKDTQAGDGDSVEADDDSSEADNHSEDDDDDDDDDDGEELDDDSEQEDEAGSQYYHRSAPWELQNRFVVSPPGERLDLTASIKTQGMGARSFATVFFDGEPETQHKEFICAFIAETQRPEGVRDRNGIALVKTEGKDGILTYKRIGFVAFWDKLIKDDLSFLYDVEKTEIELV